MSKVRLVVLLLLLLVLADLPAQAEERPIPRLPLGPGMQMVPPPRPAPPADSIRIVNRGDQRLSFSYWDGQSAWRPLSLDIRGSADIACTTCAGSIIVAYHDGTQNQQVTLKGGLVYQLGWSMSKNAWLIGPEN